MKTRLTRRELSILLYIATYQQRYGRAPTQREIAVGHRKASGTICHDLYKLRAMGFITLRPHGKRSVQLTGRDF